MLSFEEIEDCFPDGMLCHEPTGKTLVSAQWLHDFAHAVAAKEREACAQICAHRKEVLHNHMPSDHVPPGVAESAFYFTKGGAKSAGRCAAAIKARSNWK